MAHWRRFIAPFLLSVVLLVTGCSATATSPYSQAQQESTGRNAPAAVAKNAEQGSSFNQFFPPSAYGLERVYTQEKKGFAEAKLKKDGKDMAMLSISDTVSLPSAAQKYQQSTETIAGYPAVEIGSTQTGILIADRYQVKVLSRDPAFSKSDRQAWLQRFDLNGLAKLK
jgi:hypothetical protein